MIDFLNKRALVTGGTRGIGAAIAAKLLELGAEVVATGRNQQILEELQIRAHRADLSLKYIAVDFADQKSVSSMLAKIESQSFDVLINNAGINKIDLAEDIKDSDWDRIQQVNVKVPFLLCRALAPKMAKRGYGRIVNVTSIFGQVSKSKRLSYSTSKFALMGLTKALALDYAKQNVLVNGLAPGLIDTELTRGILTEEQRQELIALTPMGRLGTVEEIACVAAFLASDSNSFITGQNIVVDGGFTSV